MDNNTTEEIFRLLASLNGLECWYVSCGGAAGSTFQLALGKKLRRSIPLSNPSHPDVFRESEGEAGLFVWCAWRLDGPNGPVTSWDDTEESVEMNLGQLIGTRIESVDTVPLAWDLNIHFSNSLSLRVFCDHVPGEPSFDGNWDLRTPYLSVAVGPGTKMRKEIRAEQMQ